MCSMQHACIYMSGAQVLSMVSFAYWPPHSILVAPVNTFLPGPVHSWVETQAQICLSTTQLLRSNFVLSIITHANLTYRHMNTTMTSFSGRTKYFVLSC